MNISWTFHGHTDRSASPSHFIQVVVAMPWRHALRGTHRWGSTWSRPKNGLQDYHRVTSAPDSLDMAWCCTLAPRAVDFFLEFKDSRDNLQDTPMAGKSMLNPLIFRARPTAHTAVFLAWVLAGQRATERVELVNNWLQCSTALIIGVTTPSIGDQNLRWNIWYFLSPKVAKTRRVLRSDGCSQRPWRRCDPRGRAIFPRRTGASDPPK